MNWKNLNSQLPTLAVMRRLPMECRRIEGDEWRGRCPIHPSSGRPTRSFAVSISKRKFYCHTCKVKGDLIDLWSIVKHVTTAQAAKDLEEEFGQ